MIKHLQKHGHRLVLTKTKPEVLVILSRMGCDLHIHNEGTNLETMIKGNQSSYYRCRVIH